MNIGHKRELQFFTRALFDEHCHNVKLVTLNRLPRISVADAVWNCNKTSHVNALSMRKVGRHGP